MNALKIVVARIENNFNDKTIVFYRDFVPDWVVFRFNAKDVAYDVRKTDSLVSPFSGHITLTLLQELGANGEFKTREEAEKAADFRTGSPTAPIKWRINYAFQDGVWVYKNAEFMNMELQRLKVDREGEWQSPKKFDIENMIPLFK